MTTEYWLQKKTFGGWSHVTWYTDKDEAIRNLNAVAVPNSGYSWRVCVVELVEERLLDETVEVKQPDHAHNAAKANVWAGNSIQDKKPEWGATPAKAWGEKPAVIDPIKTEGQSSWGAPVPKAEHALTGSVWVVHHAKRLKSRIPADKLETYKALGYEIGGPRTQFK